MCLGYSVMCKCSSGLGTLVFASYVQLSLLPQAHAYREDVVGEPLGLSVEGNTEACCGGEM